MKKTEKIIASIIGIIVVIIAGAIGINEGEIDQLLNYNETSSVAGAAITGGEELEVYFIDVGQADSILLIQEDHAMLIDAGNNGDGEDVVDFIQEKGIEKLDYLIGTHPHEDHIGGLDDVISSNIQIENILMPKIQTNTKTFESVLDAITEKGITVTAPEKGDTFELGKAQCEIMNDSILDSDNLNLSSIIVRVQFGENSLLLMGDAETDNEEERNWPQSDVLKVGHHGSNTSTSEEFLEQVQPQYAIIMAGKDNSYGLPKSTILDRLESIGSKLYRTDIVGTITMFLDGENIQIETEK